MCNLEGISTLILKNRAEAGVFRVFWESERDAGSETKKKADHGLLVI